MKKFLESISKPILLFIGIFWDRIILVILTFDWRLDRLGPTQTLYGVSAEVYHPTKLEEFWTNWGKGQIFLQIILFIIGLFVIFNKKISSKLKIIIITMIILFYAILTIGMEYYVSQEPGYYTENIEYKCEQFNFKFTGYAGKQRSSSIKALMTAVASSNSNNPDGWTITVKKDGLISIPKDIQSAVTSRNTYTVEFECSIEGYINIINVKCNRILD